MFQRKTKTKLIFQSIILLIIILPITVFLFSSLCHAQYDYTPLEPIPGFEATTGPGPDQFKNFVEGIYKFGIWAVGIAALLMITVGGFTYLTSAGNTAKAGAGKEIIKNAIFGLVVALLAWLLLNIINPDLVTVTITMPAAPAGQTGASPTSPQGGAPGGATRPSTPTPGAGATANCTPMTSGDCSVSNLTNTFGNNASRMSSICHYESGGNPNRPSGADLCADRNSYSIGLYQINMYSHYRRLGYANNPFQSADSTRPFGSCLHYTVNSNNLRYCDVRNCQVANQADYTAMRTQLQNPNTNIQIAAQISNNGNNTTPWQNTANTCRQYM
jgi:hypothetical protein